MSAYTITWETYRAMQDRIAALEEMNAQFIPSKAVHEVASEMILLEAEREIARLKAEVNKLKGGK